MESKSKEHYVYLDCLRGVAALSVVILHWFEGNGYLLFHNSLLAVDFFFMLSGFVIAYSYEHKLKEGLSFSHFMLLRLIRLYPLILVGIVLGTIRFLVKVSIGSDPSFGYLEIMKLVMLNIFMLPYSVAGGAASLFPLDNALWSLFFEFIAYILYAWILYRYGRLFIC